MAPMQLSPEWEPVAKAQQQKDILTRKAIKLPIEKFREAPYRPSPLPNHSAIGEEDIAITEEWVPVRDGATVKIRIYKSLAQNTSGLLLFNAHGGGFVVGEPRTEEGQNQILTKKARCVTVSVDYRRAPEHRYPCAVNDCFDVLLWCKSNAHSLHINPQRIVLIGGSAGGNISAVLALRCLDEGVTGIVGQILNIPVVCHPAVFPVDKYNYSSYQENADAPVLSSTLMHWFWDQYLPHPNKDPYASPLLAESLAGLPPALLQVSGCDPLRDDGLAYAKALEEAGVPIVLKTFDGLPHAFYIHPQLPSTNTYMDNMVDWIAKTLL